MAISHQNYQSNQFDQEHTSDSTQVLFSLTDAGVAANGSGDLVNVSIRGLTQGRDAVDATHSLRQVGVGHKLGQLGGPQVGSDDLGGGHPVRVHRHQRGDRSQALCVKDERHDLQDKMSKAKFAHRSRSSTTAKPVYRQTSQQTNHIPGVCSPPMSTLEGHCRSVMAVPSARNSGLESTWNLNCEALASTRLTASAVRTGTVDFSTCTSSNENEDTPIRHKCANKNTKGVKQARIFYSGQYSSLDNNTQSRTTILLEVAISAIFLAHSSQFLMFAALPAPMPVIFVGVFTLMKIISASRIAASMFVEKNKFLHNCDKLQLEHLR